MMLTKISQFEENNFNSNLHLKEKGMILEKTRLLSMEFSKLKVFIMKSQISYKDRTNILNNFKLFDTSIKEILNIS